MQKIKSGYSIQKWGIKIGHDINTGLIGDPEKTLGRRGLNELSLGNTTTTHGLTIIEYCFTAHYAQREHVFFDR